MKINDPVLAAMENIVKQYGDQGTFIIDGKKYTTSEILNHLWNDTVVGFRFRTTLNEILISYLMKFEWPGIENDD